MATKTANVMVRVEPDVKEEAENIMEQLGLPVSVVINALYKKIIRTRGIPFSFTLSEEPIARDEMSQAAFDVMMQKGLEQAQNGQSKLIEEVFTELMKGL